MRILIDTHVFLWLLSDPDRLSSGSRALIEDSGNELYLSIGSLWEIAIKTSIKKLRLSIPFGVLARDYVQSLGIEVLPIAVAHLAIVEELPRHHSDPFDRLLIAQSMAESLTLMTSDTKFDAYTIALVRT